MPLRGVALQPLSHNFRGGDAAWRALTSCPPLRRRNGWFAGLHAISSSCSHCIATSSVVHALRPIGRRVHSTREVPSNRSSISCSYQAVVASRPAGAERSASGPGGTTVRAGRGVAGIRQRVQLRFEERTGCCHVLNDVLTESDRKMYAIRRQSQWARVPSAPVRCPCAAAAHLPPSRSDLRPSVSRVAILQADESTS